MQHFPVLFWGVERSWLLGAGGWSGFPSLPRCLTSTILEERADLKYHNKENALMETLNLLRAKYFGFPERF